MSELVIPISILKKSKVVIRDFESKAYFSDDTKLPNCVVCGGKGHVQNGWQLIPGTPYEWNTFKTLTKPVAKFFNDNEGMKVEQGQSACLKCKRHASKQNRKENPDSYNAPADKGVHRNYMKELGHEISVSDFNIMIGDTRPLSHIKEMMDAGIDWKKFISLYEYEIYKRVQDEMSLEEWREKRGTDLPTYDTISAMKERGIDWRIYKSVDEYDRYKLVSSVFPISLEQFRSERVGGFDYKSIYNDSNLKTVCYVTTGKEDITDYLTGQEFKNQKVRRGNSKYTEEFDTEVEDKKYLHHFVTKGGKSVFKSDKEPSSISQTGLITENLEIFVEFLGLWLLNDTSHKDHHQKFSDFDIVTAFEYGLEPWWAQSEENYKKVQERYPLISHISYQEMIDHHTLNELRMGGIK